MNRDDVICIESHSNRRIWSHLEKDGFGLFFGSLSGPTFGVVSGTVLGFKSIPK